MGRLDLSPATAGDTRTKGPFISLCSSSLLLKNHRPTLSQCGAVLLLHSDLPLCPFGLNVAVITLCYDSHVSVALLGPAQKLFDNPRKKIYITDDDNTTQANTNKVVLRGDHLRLSAFFRMYRAEKLPNTNLVFLITDAKATCLSCDPRPLRQAEQPCILSPAS